MMKSLLIASALMVMGVTTTAFVVAPSARARSRALTPTKGFTHGLSPTAVRRPARALRVAAQGLSMLVEPKGKDSFKQIEQEVEGDPLKKTVGNMTPGMAKAVLTGVIPVASTVGYLVMPGGLAVSAIGAAVSGVGGVMARKKLVQARRDSAPAQVARLLESKGVGNITPAELTETLASFGLEGEDAEDILVQIYTKYVVAMCQNSATKTSEIKELSELRETLGLNGLLMGEALYQAASPVYSQFVARTPSDELADEWSPNRRALDKFIFLCDRMFEVCDTEEAYSFEMSRISKVFDLTLPEVKMRCAAIAGPFYEKALGSAAAKWDAVKADQLQRARNTLGMQDDVATEMHKTVYRQEVSKLLASGGDEEGQPKLTAEAKQRLNKLAAAFEISEEDAVDEYEAVVLPMYQEMLVGCLSNLMTDASESELARIYGELMMFTADTKLRQSQADAVLRDIMSATLQDMFDNAAQYVRVANAKEAANATRNMVVFVKSTLKMVKMTLGEDEDRMDPYQVAIGGCIVPLESRKDAPGMYKMFLQSCFAQSQMSEEDSESIALLAKMLAIDADSQVKVYRDAAGPRVLRQLTESVQVGIDTGVWSGDAKEANEQLVEDFKIPYVVIAEQAKTLYKQTLETFAGVNPIMTVEQKETLDRMAAFLSMDDAAVADVHAEICSGTFRKAVAEAMGATGVVIAEYREKLDVLRGRLGLSVESAKLMFQAAVRQRMAPLMEQIIYEFERSVLSKDQLARKTGKDMGADVLGATGGELGIQDSKAVTSDVLALIDFYVDNGIIEKDEEGNDTYPVTAAQIGTDSRMLEALYQNFVVSGFGVEGEQLKRYEAGQGKLAGILGLDEKVKMKIHKEIGGTVIRRFVNQELSKQGKISSQGVAFLANIQNKLAMPKDMFNAMVNNCQLDYLRRQAEELFRMTSTTGKECKRLRDLASSMGMSLAEEARLDLSSRKTMFEMEAEDMIESGAMEGDAGQEFVEELTDALALTVEEAQEALVALLDSRAKGILQNVKADAIDGRDERILEAAERLLRYCRLAGGMAVENDLDGRQRNVIVNAYEAKHAGSIEEGSEGEEEKRQKVADDLDLLKIAIGMKSKAAA